MAGESPEHVDPLLVGQVETVFFALLDLSPLAPYMANAPLPAPAARQLETNCFLSFRKIEFVDSLVDLVYSV